MWCCFIFNFTQFVVSKLVILENLDLAPSGVYIGTFPLSFAQLKTDDLLGKRFVSGSIASFFFQ